MRVQDQVLSFAPCFISLQLSSPCLFMFFVFDGHGRSSTKCRKETGGKSHWLLKGFQELLDTFGLQWCEAPGEAKAELAALSQQGLIDMVLTTDNDALIFGATCIACCPNDPWHFENIEIYTKHAVTGCVYLTHADRVFMAVISGGNYNEGIQGCGINIAHGLSQYKLGKALLDAFLKMQRSEFTCFFHGWRNDLWQVLDTDPDGFLGRKYTKLAGMIPDSFPDYSVLKIYTKPLTTFSSCSDGLVCGQCPYLIESCQPCLGMLATLCKQQFGWTDETTVAKMHATVWGGAAVQLVCGVGGISMFWVCTDFLLYVVAPKAT
ncbi:hypothetical protein BS17DRAFT_706906 [Gyrodon lividus]|nr:hypothetical protein BS17DRAFT_706906 [Gyrodon lividus]